MTLDVSLLTSYYNTKAGLTASSSGGSSSTSSTSSTKTTSPTGSAKAPTSPWSSRSQSLTTSALVTNVLNGRKFINSNNVSLDVAGASADYSQLFTLYQGISALQGLATKAQEKNLTDLELTKISRRFEAGMTEVQSYISSAKYDHVSLIQGVLSENLKSSVGIAKTDATYTADMIHQGSTTSEVQAFQGDVKFSMSVNKIGSSTPTTIDFDLSEMGTSTRSMSNVVSYLNGKLEAAGLNTRYSVNRKAAVAETMTVGGKTVTLSKGQDSFGLELKGVSYETVTMSAPAKADAIYVLQATGEVPDPKAVVTTKSTTTTTDEPDITRQILKFQSDEAITTDAPPSAMSKVGDTYYASGQSQQTALEVSIAKVHASVAASDGSVFVLADVNATTSGQELKGAQDVALIKYDSAGNIVYTRTVGAADSATGYAMAISNDGKVAISGSVTGALNYTTTKTIGSVETTVSAALNGSSDSKPDSFVTVFDASGVEQWTQRRGASLEDEATAISFGDNGAVYVGGRAKSLMLGASGSAAGGYDSYLSAYSATGAHLFTEQTGTTSNDSTAVMTTEGNTLYVASILDGQTVLKSYDISSGTPTLSQSRSLGGIGGGNISGISVYNGKVYLGGSTSSSDLVSGGTVTRAYSGQQDAFALSVDANLSVTNSDTIAYFGGTGNEANAKVQFADGKAWISGQTTEVDLNGMATLNEQDAYLARLNIDTGAVESQVRYTGKDGVVSPEAIAVAKGGGSVLDRLGLPQGTIQYKDSTTLVSGTSAREGDQFFIVDKSGGKKTITIEAKDTLATLAKKITKASGYNLKVEVKKVTGKALDQLVITPANNSAKVEFKAGAVGKDALEALGLSEGLVSADANTIIDPKSSNYQKIKKPIGLAFDTTLNLNSEGNIAEAIKTLKSVSSNLQKAYTWLKSGDPQPVDSKKKNSSGTVPTYLTNQISNYQAALERLTGGS